MLALGTLVYSQKYRIKSSTPATRIARKGKKRRKEAWLTSKSNPQYGHRAISSSVSSRDAEISRAGSHDAGCGDPDPYLAPLSSQSDAEFAPSGW